MHLNVSGAVDVYNVCCWGPLNSIFCFDHVADVMSQAGVELQIFFSLTLQLVFSSSLLI